MGWRRGPQYRALYDKVYRPDILAHAYACCKANGGAAGASPITTAAANVVRPPEAATENPEDAPATSGQEILASVRQDPNDQTPLPNIRLTGTVRGLGPHPLAVIDGRLYKLGQSYKGARIVRIGNFSIEVEFHGRRRLIGFATSIAAEAPAGHLVEAPAGKQQAAPK